MKVIILAGGYGTRLSEYTDKIPKPMVLLDSKPILWHIMKSYSKYGFNEFVIALGYKQEKIKEYFLNYIHNHSDLEIDLKKNSISVVNKKKENWKISLVDTGINTLTGGRVKRLEKIIGDETFMLTYGDGVSDVNLKQLLAFHKKNKKIITMTTVRPSARFGEVIVKKNLVNSFKEKPSINSGWINGGFFVAEPGIFKYLKGDKEMLERAPLEKLVKEKKVTAFKHKGFWKCMDNIKDLEYLSTICSNKKIPWL